MWNSTASTRTTEHGYKPVVDQRYDNIMLTHIDQTSESDLHLLLRIANEYGAIVKLMSTRLCFVVEGLAEKADGKSLPSLNLNPEDVFNWRVCIAYRHSFNSVKAKWHDKVLGKTVSETIGQGDPVYEFKHLFASAIAARKAAEGKLQKSRRGSSTVSISLPGCMEASAKRQLQLQGFRSGVDGLWVCKKVEHQLSASGFTTHIEGETLEAKV